MKISAARAGDITTLLLSVGAVILTLASGSQFWLYNLTLVAIFATAAVGLNLVLGLAGQVSFAQTTFMAIGGYASAKLTTQSGMNPWLALLIAAAGAGVFAALLALPLLRLRGHYLAMATFALAIGTQSFVSGDVGLTGGATGISAVPPLSIGGTQLSSPSAFLIVSWTMLALALFVFFLLSRSHIGRAWRALARGQDVAVSLAVPVRRLKIIALVIAAVMGSVAGTIYAQFNLFVSPDFFDLSLVINLFLIVFIGGLGSLTGPILGAAAVVLIPQLFSGAGGWQDVVFYVLLLGLMVLLPSGLLGALPTVRRSSGNSLEEQPDTTPAAPELERVTGLGLQVDGLTKHFGGVTAVDDVSFDVLAGEIHGLIGPNGAGKSTLLALVSGSQRPDRGEVLLGQTDIAGSAPLYVARAGLARTFQAATPFNGLTVRENVQVGLHSKYKSGVLDVLFGTPRLRREERRIGTRTRELLYQYGLGVIAERSASDLPFGQLRFLEIARAVARQPQILLLDEPAAGLSTSETGELGELLRKINSAGTTILVIDHDVPFLFGICANVTAIDFGHLLASGPPEQIAADVSVRAAYLGHQTEEAHA
jgi:branched-chain amino acid transport system permease protein